MRRDSLYCRQSCRQAAHRFGRALALRERAGLPLRLAYADPPYPGKAHLYRDHPDYGGEVDHLELLSRLHEYDGWALSTSSSGLRQVFALCDSLGILHVRVAAWVRGARTTPAAGPLSSWEPVVYRGARQAPRNNQVLDSLVYTARPRLTDPCRVIGAKPAAYISWIFGLLDARVGDTLDDLYPGSGGVQRAWELVCERRSVQDLAQP